MRVHLATLARRVASVSQQPVQRAKLALRAPATRHHVRNNPVEE